MLYSVVVVLLLMYMNFYAFRDVRCKSIESEESATVEDWLPCFFGVFASGEVSGAVDTSRETNGPWSVCGIWSSSKRPLFSTF